MELRRRPLASEEMLGMNPKEALAADFMSRVSGETTEQFVRRLENGRVGLERLSDFAKKRRGN